MLSWKKSTTTSVDHLGANLITAIHPDIIQTHILTRLDGASLASISCASSQLLSLCSDDQLWWKICNSTWPSTTDPRVLRAISAFPSAHRSFYLDSFRSAHPHLPKITCQSDTSELISAVDIYYKDQVIYSKVLETETTGDRFLNHPLILRLLDPTEIVPMPLEFEGDQRTCMSLAKEQLKISWIVIDPDNKRAVNIVSHQAVEPMLLSWIGDMMQLRYTTVVTTGKLALCTVLVTCSWQERGKSHVKQVNMYIEDMDRKLSVEGSVGGFYRPPWTVKWRIKDNYEIFSNRKKLREL